MYRIEYMNIVGRLEIGVIEYLEVGNMLGICTIVGMLEIGNMLDIYLKK